MWDYAGYSNFTRDYCENCDGVCPECPRPKVLADCLPSIAAYGSVSTQWTHAPNGARTGLRYSDCLPMLDRVAARWHAEGDMPFDVNDLMDDVQVIESAMIGADREAIAQLRADRGDD